MFNKTIDVKIVSSFETLLKDKILGIAGIPEEFYEVPNNSKCPFSKFSKYLTLPTIKHCNGIQHFFNKTLLLNSWTDVWLKTNEINVEYELANKNYTVSQHANEQYRPMYEGLIAPKLEAPFFIIVPNGTQVLGSEAFYHFKNNRTYKNLKFPSGIIPNSFRPNVIGMMNSNEETFIKYNDPLMYFTFLTDKKIKVHYELVKQDEMHHFFTQLNSNKFVGGLKDKFNGTR